MEVVWIVDLVIGPMVPSSREWVSLMMKFHEVAVYFSTVYIGDDRNRWSNSVLIAMNYLGFVTAPYICIGYPSVSGFGNILGTCHRGLGRRYVSRKCDNIAPSTSGNAPNLNMI